MMSANIHGSRKSLLRAVVAVGLLLQASLGQKIQTNTNTEGAYTTGNKLDLPEMLDLYSPPPFEIPMLLDSTLYETINQHQSFKNSWIVDISNIDPKVPVVQQEFAPEEPTFNLAVQRRGIPYFYLGRIFLILIILLILARLFYGYLGGFRSKVRILKGPEKRIGNQVLTIGTVLFVIFSSTYLLFSYVSITLSEQYLSDLIFQYAKENQETVLSVFVGCNDQNHLERINNSSEPAYYAENEFEMMHISNLMGSLIPESKLSIEKAAAFKKSVETFQQRHLSNAVLAVISVYILMSVVRYAHGQRKIFLSLGSSFAFLGVIVYLCILNGTQN